MKVNWVALPLEKETIMEEDIDFSHESFDPNFLRQITCCHAKAKLTRFMETLRVVLSVKASVIAVCAYSLEDVPLNLNLREELDFTRDKEDEENIYLSRNNFTLDEYVLDLILTSIPPKVIKKGASLPESGKGYRVLSEEDFLKEREEKKDPRWEKLDSVKINDDK